MKKKALTWLEIQQQFNKPVWDADGRKWRVIDGYKEYGNNEKSISFTDSSNWWDLDSCELYLEELEEE